MLLLYWFPRFNLFECLESRERINKHKQFSYIFEFRWFLPLPLSFLAYHWRATPHHTIIILFFHSVSLYPSRYHNMVGTMWEDAFFCRRLLTMSSTFRLLFYPVRPVTGRRGGSFWREVGERGWAGWWREQESGRRRKIGGQAVQEPGGGDWWAGRQLAIAGRGKKFTWQRLNVIFFILTTLAVLFNLKNREGINHKWQITEEGGGGG